jgi:hypothetical protein
VRLLLLMSMAGAKKPSLGAWTGGEWTGEGSCAEFAGELGGTTGAGCEEEAKSEIGPGLKPREFPRRLNHSILHA